MEEAEISKKISQIFTREEPECLLDSVPKRAVLKWSLAPPIE